MHTNPLQAITKLSLPDIIQKVALPGAWRWLCCSWCLNHDAAWWFQPSETCTLPILIWLIISWNIVWYHSISMHILDLVAWRHERLPRHSPYSLAKGRLFIWSYLIAFTAQLLLESFQSLFVDFQLHEYQAWHRYHDSQQIPPPANAKGTLQRKRSKCDCGPSTVGFDRFVQGWAANRVYNDSVGTAITIVDLIHLINLIKSYLFTVGDC